MYILLTREERDSLDVAKVLLERYRIPTIVSPLFTIDHVDTDFPKDILCRCEGLIFTSSHAVRHFDHTIRSDLHQKPVFCVGEKTARIASICGYSNVLLPWDNISAMQSDILNIYGKMYANNLVYIRGVHVSIDIEEWLTAYDISVYSHIVYNARAVSCMSDNIRDMLLNGGICGVMLYSVRSSLHFISLFSYKEIQLFSKTCIIAISHKVMKVARDAGFENILVADKSTGEHMLEAASMVWWRADP
mgnify:FL=1